MTREEAKEILTHNWTRVDNPNYSESELDEAFFMAIEALSADVVSRDVYDKRIQADEEIIDSYREKLANCHKEILRLLDFGDAIERQNDVIEVVRCKDCRWWEYVQGDGDCIRHTSDTLGYAFGTNAEDFCSFGERRG